MRRTSFLPLVAVVALTLGACGTSGSDDEAGATTTTESEASGSTTTGATTTATEEPGSGDLVDVEAWAEQFCGDFETWMAGVTETGESVGSAIQQGDLEAARVAIVGLFEGAASQTDTFIEAMEAGGAPDIDEGEDFLADLVEKFESFRDAMVTAGDEAAAADTSDPAAFQTTITELVAEYQAETQMVGESFAELDAVYGDQDLDAALATACTFM